MENALLDQGEAMSIYAHLHELNEPYKEVFMLRVFGELEYAQIAKLFGKTESWARVTYHRAKTRLTESVKEVSVEEPAVVQKKEKKPIGESLKLMAKNDQLVYSVLSTFIACVGIIGRYGVLSYYVIYVVGSYTLIAPVFSIMSFAQMVGNMPLPWLTKKFGKVRVYIWANIATAVVLAVLFLLFMTPNNAVIIALSAVVGFLGASGSISYSFTCDAVEYGDWKYGIRDDGLAFSIMSFLSEPTKKGYWADENFERLARAEQLAKERGVSVATIAMAWLFNQELKVIPIQGGQVPGFFSQNLKAADFKLTEREVRWLNLEV